MDIRLKTLLVLLFSGLFCQQASAISPLHGFVASENEVTHVEISRATPYNYKFKNVSPQVFELRLPELSQASRNEFLKFKDDHLKSVEIMPSDITGEWIVRFTAHAEVDGFDYLTDDPGRLIIDFYKKEKEQVTAKKSEPNKTASQDTTPKDTSNKVSQVATSNNSNEKTKSKGELQANNASKISAKGNQKRGPASSELIRIESPTMKNTEAETGNSSDSLGEGSEIQGVYDGGDPEYKRFTIQDFEIDPVAVVSSRQNLYLPFPIIEFDNQPLRDLERSTPKYEIKAGPSKENKLSRLIILLFNEKKWASFQKSLSEFRKIFPDSKYEEVLKFMEADQLYGEWKSSGTAESFDRALTSYKYLATQYPKSQLYKRTQLLILYSQIDRGFFMGAIRSAEGFLNEFKNSEEIPDVKIALAHSLMQMKKYSDAMTILDDLIASDAPVLKRAYAALYKGNVAFKNKQLDLAVEHYRSGYKQFPEAKKVLGLGLYNMGEALFWLDKKKESLDLMREFLQKFPNPEFGGYALTRMGEVLEALGAPANRSSGALKECMFRFAGSGGAKVAEIKTLIRRMKDMKPKELEVGINAINKLQKELVIPEVPTYVNFLLTQGFAERGEYEKATKGLIDFYQAHPNVETRDFYNKNIAKYITSEIIQKTEDHENFEALRKFNRYSSSWLKSNKRLDTLYYAGLSYEKIGSGERALENYLKVEEGLIQSMQDDKIKESHIIEKLPTLDQLHLRMASAYEKSGRYDQAALVLDKIKNSEDLENAEQIEESLLSAKIEESKGDDQKALSRVKKVIQLWKDRPEFLPPAYLRSAQLNQKLKKTSESIEDYKRVIASAGDKKLISKAQDGLARVYEQAGETDNAISTLQAFISGQDKDEDVSEAKYRLGALLFKQKRYDLAKESWQNVADKKTVWAKLAQDRLKETEWNKEYDKYIDRIPAMQNTQPQKDQ